MSGVKMVVSLEWRSAVISVSELEANIGLMVQLERKFETPNTAISKSA
jgi:hypothetical protein